ncbi:MAG TPA: hypothetical protein VHS58_09530 [Acetobacteraceae bacterium]|nr:hypothetical protein [Acetobacteraceae bacterium]
MTRRDAIGGGIVVLAVALLLVYRHTVVEARAWAAACALADRPAGCGPRAALLWLQYHGLWGFSALACGLWAFLGGRFGAAAGAVALGGAAAINYNATFGVLGAALGVWAWVRREHAAGRASRI